MLNPKNYVKNNFLSSLDLSKEEVINTLEIAKKFKNNHLDADSSISNCEFLIAFDGSVMVSSEQTKNIKIEELPDSLVIVAYTSQIVKNISEGLNGIQIKYGQSRPSLVTTIRTKESISTMSDSDRTKDLYVFLIEDFKEKR